LGLIKELSRESEQIDPKIILELRGKETFKAEAKIENLEFSYANDGNCVLRNVNLNLNEGETIAIVGPSGAGKSTLVDILLGLYSPTSGLIELSGVAPNVAIKTWPGLVAYVPQNVFLITGTISENVALGYSEKEIDRDRVEECIKVAQLNDYVQALPDGLETQVGESALRMSGGQLQRLGIARALYTRPKLLVLDEATSSLDGKTELDVSEAILELRGKITIVLIAHRLSTVLKADRIVYLEDGKILSIGNFEQVKTEIPEFAQQAKLIGL
jgi:ABC-type multidrug transport system fused ATPase/permease subunit